jgi:hypothetical protein
MRENNDPQELLNVSARHEGTKNFEVLGVCLPHLVPKKS